jgi:large subunit ribosomal protein L30
MARPRAEAGSKASPAGGAKKTITIKQIRSGIGFKFDQRRTLEGLGLRRPGRSVVLEDSPSVRGMVAKIPHLVRIEEA